MKYPTSSPKTPSVKTPAATKQQTINRFNTNWASRIAAFKTVPHVNMDAHVRPVFEDDRQRVMQGKQPYSNAQIANFVKALQTGKAPVSKTDTTHHGILGIGGNLVSDVGKITAGLHPQTLVPALYKGALGLDAFTARALGDILATHKYKPGTTTPVTGLLNQLQSWIPGYSQEAKSVASTVEQANKMGVRKGVPFGLRNIPGVNMIPGTYTAANVWEGKEPSEFYKHPGFGLLDILPYAGTAGKVAAGLKYGEAAADPAAAVSEGIIPKGSAYEALAEGKPLKALVRATGKTGGPDMPAGMGTAATRAAQRWGVAGDIKDVVGRWSQNLREGAVGQKFLRYRDGYHDTYVQSLAKFLDIEKRIKEAEKDPNRIVTGIMRHEYSTAKDALAEAEKNVRRVGGADLVHYIWGNHSIARTDLMETLQKTGMHPIEARDYIAANYVNLYDWSGRWAVDAEFKNILTDGNANALRDAMVPRYITGALDKLNTARNLPKPYTATTSLFKYAVLTGPRHLSHVLFSNGMFMALDDLGTFKWTDIKQAFDARHDLGKLGEGIPSGVGIFGRDVQKELATQSVKDLQDAGFTAEQIHAIRQGHTMARILSEHWGKGEGNVAETAFNKLMTSKWSPGKFLNPVKYRQWEETITNMSRAMEYIRGHDEYLKGDSRVTMADEAIKMAKSDLGRGAKTSMQLGKALKGKERAMTMAEADAHAAGLAQVSRVLMDVDRMTPIERTILRQVFPFYPFTRQLIKYMMQFPAEHPMKAAVLAAIGRIETEDAATGLPMKFMTLFPITGSDKSGNAWFVDTKNMNPFRSMNGLSPFTRAGFMSSLNPLITLPFQASGMNVLSATPELFPDLTVDPETGNLVYKPKQPLYQTLAEEIVPQFQTVEGMMGWSKNLNELHQSDPEAYARVMWSNLNLPFTTGKRNIAREQIRYARNQYSVAQQDVANAAKGGSVGSLPYTQIPYQGKLYTPQQLQKALGQ